MKTQFTANTDVAADSVGTSHATYRQAFERAPLLQMLLTRDGRVVSANDAARRWLGDPRALLELSVKELFVTLDTIEPVSMASLFGRKSPLLVYRREGEPICPAWLELRDLEQGVYWLGIRVPGTSAELVTQKMFRRDTVPQGPAASALRSREHRLSVALDQILEGCQIVDRDYRYSYLNDAAERQTRRPKSELLQRTLMEAWPGIESTQLFAVIHDTLTTGNTHVIETEFNFPDGEVGFFEMRIVPVPAGAFLLSIDRTGRRRAEQEREHLRKRLAHAQALEAVGQLSGGIAHDFNNMLAVILTHTDLSLQTLAADHPMREDLEVIRHAAQRSANLTTQLLTFACVQTSGAG